jgi:hypothetical protein
MKLRRAAGKYTHSPSASAPRAGKLRLSADYILTLGRCVGRNPGPALASRMMWRSRRPALKPRMCFVPLPPPVGLACTVLRCQPPERRLVCLPRASETAEGRRPERTKLSAASLERRPTSKPVEELHHRHL